MKKSYFLWISALLILVGGISSCSNDDESETNLKEVVFENNPTTLNGIWHMVSASFGLGGTESYQAGEITITFDETEKTMKVENRKNIHFLKNGNYTFKTTIEKSRIYTYQWVDVENQVITIQYSVDTDDFREVKYTYGIQDGILYFDGGIASDGPGYYFKKQAN